MSDKVKPVVTAQQLRNAAETALWLDDFLNRCGEAGVLWLIGFDLPWLAEQFEATAAKHGSQDTKGIK